jgi:hypothetical protein
MFCQEKQAMNNVWIICRFHRKLCGMGLMAKGHIPKSISNQTTWWGMSLK